MSAILSLLAAAAVSVSAMPAQPAACDPSRAGRADLNGDGVITQAEARTTREQAFAQLDRNGDGIAEMSDAPMLLRNRYADAFEPLLAQFDADEDGRLSAAEFLDGPGPAFELGDADGDGALDEAERAALRRARCGDAAAS